ncbi:hypothetical protein KA012_03105, partial [Candidatus Woesebacteria bacterium]|nr:hypothetical protein [Candidatus Woesebacteria bacterium]
MSILKEATSVNRRGKLAAKELLQAHAPDWLENNTTADPSQGIEAVRIDTDLLQPIINELGAMGYRFFLLVTEDQIDPTQALLDAIEAKLASENASQQQGDVAISNFPTNIIACHISYGTPGVICLAGKDARSVLGDDALRTVASKITLVLDSPGGADDPSQGVLDGLLYARQKLSVSQQEAATTPTPMPTPMPTPTHLVQEAVYPTPTVTESVGQPERLVDKLPVSTHAIVATLALSIAVSVISAMLGEKQVFAPRRELLRRIEVLLLSIDANLANLNDGNEIVLLAADLFKDYPERAAATNAQYDQFKSELAALKTSVAEIEESQDRSLVFRTNGSLAETRNTCVELLAQSRFLMEELERASQDRLIVQAKIQDADGRIQEAQDKCSSLSRRLTTTISTYPNTAFFTCYTQIIQRMDAFLETSDELKQSGKVLTALDLAEELLEVDEATFEDVANELVEAYKSINALKEKKFAVPKIVADLLAGSDEKLEKLATDLKKQTWTQISRRLVDAKDTAVEGLTIFNKWVGLQSQNEAELIKLSREVATLSAEYDSTFAADWKQLERYEETNYPGFKSKVEGARLTLGVLFDDPDNESDLVSLAAAYNSMDKQEFDVAQTHIADMYRDLTTARIILSQISVQLRDIERSQELIPQAFEDADREIKLAQASFADDLDRVVSEAIELEVPKAMRVLAEAKILADAGDYLHALERATQSLRIARLCKESAESEARKVFSDLSALDKKFKLIGTNLQILLGQIHNEPATTVDKSFFDRSAQLQSTVAPLYRQLIELQNLEEGDLLRGIKNLQVALEDIDESIGNMSREFKAARIHYERELNKTLQAVQDAGEVVQAARRKTVEYGAGTSGASDLQLAISSLPGYPYSGQSLSDLTDVQSSAAQAKRYAERAIQAAQRSIDRSEQFSSSGSGGGDSSPAPTRRREPQPSSPSWLPD